MAAKLEQRNHLKTAPRPAGALTREQEKRLQTLIDETESEQSFDSVFRLFQLLSERFNKEFDTSMSGMQLRAASRGSVQFKTKIAEVKVLRTGRKVSKKERLDLDPEYKVALEGELANTPQQYHRLVLKAKASPAARLKLVCLQCQNWSRVEVRDCEAAGNCAIWRFRPYQKPFLILEDLRGTAKDSGPKKPFPKKK